MVESAKRMGTKLTRALCRTFFPKALYGVVISAVESIRKLDFASEPLHIKRNSSGCPKGAKRFF
jgi:hypothetical protein